MDSVATIQKLGLDHGANLQDMIARNGRDDEDELLVLLYRRMDETQLAEVPRNESFRLIFGSLMSNISDLSNLDEFSVAFVAALIEERLKPELSVPQSTTLNSVYRQLLRRARALKLWDHAIVLARLGSRLELKIGNGAASDTFLYVSGVAEDKNLGRVVGWRVMRRYLIGYGYRPYRLIVAWFISAIIFTLAYWALGQKLADAGVLSASAQLGAAVVSNTLPGGDITAWLIVVQIGLGILTISVFFALVVRRWVRA
jgi:hypothetical protein